MFGYDNVPVTSTNAAGELVRSHTDYQINEAQAEVVRAIFRMRAAGLGFATVAKTLNSDPGCSAHSEKFLAGKRPASPRKGTGSWAPSSVRAILFNKRYRGRVPFGKFRNVYRSGAKARVKSDALDWPPRPDLRIVSEELWAVAQQHNAAAARTYLRGTDGQLWGRPGVGVESKYLLTGLGHCTCCGGNITVLGGSSGGPGRRKKIYYYGCSYRQNRGSTVCTNGTKVRMEQLDAAVLDALEQQVLTPEVIAAVVERAAQLVVERRQQTPERTTQIDCELRKLRRELENLLALAASGDAPQSVLTEIRKREGAIETLDTERAQLTAAEPQTLDGRRLQRALEERAEQLRALLAADVPRARQALRSLLSGPLRFSPTVIEERKGYTFEGQTKVGALLDPANVYMGVASPRGFAEISVSY